MKKARFELRLEDDIKSKLEMIAEARSITLGKRVSSSALVHEAIKKLIKKYVKSISQL